MTTQNHVSPVSPDPGAAETPAPVVYPMPAPDDDARFTFGLTLDIGEVLAEHGYPPIKSGADYVRLRQAVFGFLYAPAPPGPAASSLPNTLADPGTPARGDDNGQAL
ncbi:MAG TPA: hypothetical protein VF755_07175 [Catenuloplanes sp.]|jgi:hypothetical protein